MSRDELIVVVRRQAGQLAVQDRQISEMAGQLAQLMEANEALAGKLARLEHLLSRNSGNSSNPPSRDDDPGKPAPPDRQRGRGGPKRPRGKQRGASGAHLAWTDHPDQRRDRFPEGRCDCGDGLDRARDLGVVDRYQQHEIPQVAVTVTQYGRVRARMIGRTAGVLGEVGQRIRTLITLAYAVCCDETPLRVGPRSPAAGKKKAER